MPSSTCRGGHTTAGEVIVCWGKHGSVAGYLARRLAIDWLPAADWAALGVFTISELVDRTLVPAGQGPAGKRNRSHPVYA